jgi:hypothetical protein
MDMGQTLGGFGSLSETYVIFDEENNVFDSGESS